MVITALLISARRLFCMRVHLFLFRAHLSYKNFRLNNKAGFFFLSSLFFSYLCKNKQTGSHERTD